ncbi:MAG: diguanylate phosphodiesterase [Ilumatobacteraceae bacterium]|nr:diguanylate phosphodiesterase [Ilumatobacteraceae bacterium]
MATNVFLGRQPIFDRQRRTYAYELLYRNDNRNVAFFSDPDDATRQVLEVAMLEWGFDRVIGDRFGFINADSGIVHSGMLALLPVDRAVVELVETIEIDDALIASVREARLRGMRFALDDLADLDRPRIGELAGMIDVVKIDLSLVPAADLGRLVDDVRTMFKGADLLAEKVEDPAQFKSAADLGFDLFQGYFFAKPEVLKRAERPANLAAAVQLLAEANQPNVHIDRIEALIASDPTLAYGLLKVVNSSSYGLTVHVQSIRHAIVMLGIAQVRQLAMLLTMAGSGDGVSDELVVLAATRARMAARLAGDDAELANGAFTAGLLSVIDVVFHSSMHELVADLPLPNAVRRALLDGTGPVGNVLAAVYAFERADAAALERLRPDDDSGLLRDAFGDSAEWAENLRRTLAPV